MKARIFIFAIVFLLAFNLVIPKTVLSEEGPPKDKKWKGEGTVIESQSMPTMTIKNFLNGTVPERTETIWGTLKPMFFSKAPMARKLAPSASAGLSIPLIDLKPLKKYFKFIKVLKLK